MSNFPLPFNICDGSELMKQLWDILTYLNDKIYIDSVSPTPKRGMLWWDTANNKLYVSDGSSWFQVYPSTAGDFKVKVSSDDTTEDYLKNEGVAEMWGLIGGNCGLCETCAIQKDKPCRHQDKARMSIESIGIDVVGLLNKLKLDSNFHKDRITWTGCILY